MSVGRFAALKLNELAGELKAGGKPVIHPGGDEPEEKIPQDAYDVGLEKLKSGLVLKKPPEIQVSNESMVKAG
ncbi:MAG: hypothetical protein HY796_08605 [Elusimicrobia bacterium]|nr:hypothetical protein [Elusimicrobiota bacterium]